MVIPINSENDFEVVVDGLEAVRLQRRSSSEVVSIAGAWRFSLNKSEATPSNGLAVQTDVVWQLSWPSNEPLPRLGDRILDEQGAAWTILRVESNRPVTRLRCVTRELRIVHHLEGRLDIQTAVWETDGEATTVVDWLTVASAVPARLQPKETELNQVGDASSQSHYEITIDSPLPLDHNHRLVDSEGSIYGVLRYYQSERIDKLPIVEALRQEETG